MTNSQFCVRQRQQEQQRLKKVLILGFVGSAVVHSMLAYTLPRWSYEPTKTAKKPMELILIDKPKPRPKSKIESQPVVEPKPKPLKPPETVKAQTPPPPVEPSKPFAVQTRPLKPAPAPKKVLTAPIPAPTQPIVSAPVENTTPARSLNRNLNAPSSSVTSTENSSDSPGVPGSTVAINSAPPPPKSNREPSQGISCVSNCKPEYPTSLKGVEGSAGVKLTINKNGNVIGAELADADSNSQINRQALLAARQMQFSSLSDDVASIRVKIDFTVEGSEYDRHAREEQEKREQAEREHKEFEASRQQQLEAEQQAQQKQLERERQARQKQLQQQQESTPPPANTKPTSKPLPTLSPDEWDAERLRKFRERIENYQ